MRTRFWLSMRLNRLLIGGICEPFRWGVDDVGLSDLGMASFIRSASPSAVVLTITLSLGRSMTRRSRIAARGPARSSYRPAEGCRSVGLRVRPAERAGPARRHWRRLSPFEPAGLPWTTPFRTPPGGLRNPRRTPFRFGNASSAPPATWALRAWSRSAETALIGAAARRTGSR